VLTIRAGARPGRRLAGSQHRVVTWTPGPGRRPLRDRLLVSDGFLTTSDYDRAAGGSDASHAGCAGSTSPPISPGPGPAHHRFIPWWTASLSDIRFSSHCMRTASWAAGGMRWPGGAITADPQNQGKSTCSRWRGLPRHRPPGGTFTIRNRDPNDTRRRGLVRAGDEGAFLRAGNNSTERVGQQSRCGTWRSLMARRHRSARLDTRDRRPARSTGGDSPRWIRRRCGPVSTRSTDGHNITGLISTALTAIHPGRPADRQRRLPNGKSRI